MSENNQKLKITVTLPVGEKEKNIFMEAAPLALFRFVSDNHTDEIKISPQYPQPVTYDACEEDVRDADIILGNVSLHLLEEASKLKFLQLNSAGANQYTACEAIKGVTLCCASGAYGVAIAEHMLSMVMCMIKRLEKYAVNRKNGIWNDEGSVSGIFGSETLVLGAGNIGTEFARRMNALGSRCIAIRRKSSKPDEIFAETGTMEDIDKYLKTADFVACALPETAQTRGLFDRKRFSLMKKNALFINVGRGTITDSCVLADVLNEEIIGGACIDVTDTEPLEKDSPLWQAKNLILTPHVSGGYHLQYTYDSIVSIMVSNLKNYLAGDPLISEVDPESGYRIRP